MLTGLWVFQWALRSVCLCVCGSVRSVLGADRVVGVSVGAAVCVSVSVAQ